MREIDSTHNSEARLRQALRILSANAPGEAPPQIGDTLTGAFRRHHARRRAIRRIAIAAVVIAVLLPEAVMLLRRQPAPVIETTHTPAPVSPPVATPAVPTEISSGGKAGVRKFRPNIDAKQTARAHNDFVVLPSSVHAVHGEELRLIRMEVTGRALQVVGAPVSDAIADHRVLADFVVGQDGTPYAVRLVHQNTHF